MKRFFLVFLFGILYCGLIFSQSQGRTMYVTVNSAEVKASTGFFSDTLGTLTLGSTVTAVQEKGKWIEVQSGVISGWVAAASLSSKRITGQGHSAAAGEIALAGKGFSSEVEMEYRQNGLDYSIVDSMERQRIVRQDLYRFITDGRLSLGE
jgi:hypothetical protein